MKTFQKITLAAAISAAPFMSQAMEALDDTVLGNTTGQAGVTIEIDIADSGVTVGEIEYIDEGSVLLQNINISNADITQTIDVVEDGSLVLGTSAITDLTMNIGNINNLGVVGTVGTASALALKGVDSTGKEAITEVVNDIHLVADMGASTVTLVNLQNSENATAYGINQSFNNGVDPVSNAADGSLAIKMQASIDINDLDIGLFGYTQDQANAKVAAAAGVTVAVADANGDGVLDDATLASNAAQIAGGSGVGLNNIQFYDKDAGGNRINATMSQTIWAKGGTVAQGGGVYIAMGAIKGTLDIGGIVMGGNSIGQVKVSNIDLSGMTQRIYGHQ